MPLIQVYHPKDSLSPERRAALAESLTAVILEIEGGADRSGPAAQSIAWVMFHEIDAGSWFIGGKADDTYVSPPGRFLVRVYVPEGSLSRARKAMVHKAVDDAIFAAFGIEPPEGRWPSVFAHIHEWGEGNLGLFGRTVGLADVGAYAAVGNPEVRARGAKYLAARAAWRDGAGFPE